VRCTRQNVTCVFGLRQRRMAHLIPEPASRPQSQAILSEIPQPDQRGSAGTTNLDTLCTTPSLSPLLNLNVMPETNTLGPRLSQTSDDFPLISNEEMGLSFNAAIDADWQSFPSLGFSPGVAAAGRDWCFQSDGDASGSRRRETPDVTTMDSFAPPSKITRLDDAALDPIQSIRELADLNVRLYEHTGTLPPVHSVVLNQAPSEEGRLFAIDETFKMTQSLIDIIHRLYPPHEDISTFAPDQGTVLLLLSCANRVFDIYETIFSHMRGCIKYKLTPVHADGATVTLPSFKIGSFSPPNPAAMTMHMLMVILMASNLFDQLQEVLGIHTSEANDITPSPLHSSHDQLEVELAVGTRSHFPEFTDEARSEVSRRARLVAGEIISIRQLILDIPGMRGAASMASYMVGQPS